MTYDDYGEETRNSIMLEFGHERVRREELKEQCVSILTTIHVCLIMAKMMDYAKKTVNENADGIEDCLKNPKNKGKYINEDDAKKEKGLNAILDDAKATFENQATQAKENMNKKLFSFIQETADEKSKLIITALSEVTSPENVYVAPPFNENTRCLFKLYIVSQLSKAASKMVQNENVQKAAQTTAEKIDEIDFDSLKWHGFLCNFVPSGNEANMKEGIKKILAQQNVHN